MKKLAICSIFCLIFASCMAKHERRKEALENVHLALQTSEKIDCFQLRNYIEQCLKYIKKELEANP